MPTQQFFSYIMSRTSCTSWIFLVLAHLNKQSMDRHISPHRHIILVLSQPVFALSP